MSDTPEAPDAGDEREREIREAAENDLIRVGWPNAQRLLRDAVRLLDAARTERDTLRRDAESTYCAFCGHAIQVADKWAANAQMTAHIRVCPNHPMRALEADNARLRASQGRLREQIALASPEHGHRWVQEPDEKEGVIWCQWCGVHRVEVPDWTDNPECPIAAASSAPQAGTGARPCQARLNGESCSYPDCDCAGVPPDAPQAECTCHMSSTKACAVHGDVPRYTTCPDCAGMGWLGGKPGPIQRCERCHATGTLLRDTAREG